MAYNNIFVLILLVLLNNKQVKCQSDHTPNYGPLHLTWKPNLCLDIWKNNFDTKSNPSHIQVWNCGNADNQKFYYFNHKIYDKNGKCLDIHRPDYDNNINNALVQFWDCNGQDNQYWTYNSDTHTIKNKKLKCLDLHIDDFWNDKDGGKVSLWGCNEKDGFNQIWTINTATAVSIPTKKPTKKPTQTKEPTYRPEYNEIHLFAPVLKFDWEVTYEWDPTDNIQPSFNTGPGPSPILHRRLNENNSPSSIPSTPTDMNGQIRRLARKEIRTFGYPMNAQTYVDMGRPSKYNNNKLDTNSNPTYYKTQHCNGKEYDYIIMYFWFYGYQSPCTDCCGAHTGDWEFVYIYVKNKNIFKIRYWHHGDNYDKYPSSIEYVGTHPVVYVGQVQHGSFYDKNTKPTACLTLWDIFDYGRRNPKSENDWLRTYRNLKDIQARPVVEPWMDHNAQRVVNCCSQPRFHHAPDC